jgi:hypothetical protein
MFLKSEKFMAPKPSVNYDELDQGNRIKYPAMVPGKSKQSQNHRLGRDYTSGIVYHQP